MSAENEDYFAPTVSEHTLDPGGNYVSPATSVNEAGPGVLSNSKPPGG